MGFPGSRACTSAHRGWGCESSEGSNRLGSEEHDTIRVCYLLDIQARRTRSGVLKLSFEVARFLYKSTRAGLLEKEL